MLIIPNETNKGRQSDDITFIKRSHVIGHHFLINKNLAFAAQFFNVK